MYYKYVDINILIHYIKIVCKRIDAAKPSLDKTVIRFHIEHYTNMAWRCLWLPGNEDFELVAGKFDRYNVDCNFDEYMEREDVKLYEKSLDSHSGFTTVTISGYPSSLNHVLLCLYPTLILLQFL